MGTRSGTVMVVRTGGGACGPAVRSAAVPTAASRGSGLIDAVVFGEVSGKNPRPCLPAEEKRTSPVYPRGGAATPTLHSRLPGRACSPPAVGRPARPLGQE